MITPEIIKLLEAKGIETSRQNIDYWKKKLLTEGVDYVQYRSATVFTPDAAKTLINHLLTRGNRTKHKEVHSWEK